MPLSGNKVEEDVYRILLENIVSLKFSFGERIDTKKLEKEFGVSQTPIRGAIARLIKDGLIYEKPRRGYYIIDLTKQDLEDIYDLRIMIESYALKKGMARIDKKELQRLLGVKKKILKESPKAVKPKEYIIADRQFHLCIVKSHMNTRLHNMYLHIYPLVEISQQLDPLYQRSNKEHIDLIEAILEGKNKEAVTMLQQHLEHCKIDGIKALIESRNYSKSD